MLAGASLTLSRLGLIVHEWIGHGGTAVALGGTVTGGRLFWFAGGWIRYRLPSPGAAATLAVALGGIAIETVLGLALWVALGSRTDLGGRIVRTAGAALLVHAMFYLAIGTWHGYGDGRVVRELAGDARVPVAIAAGAAACAAGWAGARHLFGALRAAVPGRPLAGPLLAIAVAAAINAGLDLGELRLRRDTTYSVIMQPERERVVARELARWQRAQPEPVSAAERTARQRALSDEHRELPFGWLLGAALAGALVAGAAQSATPATPARPAGRLVALACGAAVIATAVVIAVDAGVLAT